MFQVRAILFKFISTHCRNNIYFTAGVPEEKWNIVHPVYSDSWLGWGTMLGIPVACAI